LDDVDDKGGVESATTTEPVLVELSRRDRFVGRMLLLLTSWLGPGSLLFFFVFLIVGPLHVINLGLSEQNLLVFDTVISLVFFVQHSGMVRAKFRQWLGRFVREPYHAALYSILSGFILITLILSWQESGIVVVRLGGLTRWAPRALCLLGLAGFVWTTRSLGKFDGFGRLQLFYFLRSKKPPPPLPMSVRGPYRWVRHPVYLFCLMAIWSSPDVTADRLLLNVMWTVWIVIGSALEERDLLAEFGEDYAKYRRKVPMLFPRSIRPC